MKFLPLIESKREGHRLGPDQIQQFISEYVAGDIPDYQMAAMLMAIYFRGLDVTETRALTVAMRDSGDVLEFPPDPRPIVDKHSTGGVGDKISLPLAPLLACLDFRVPMISGRGLGITGGTLDKLESIPGFRTMLSREEIIQQVQEVGCVICGQTERMVPADKKLYALRDVTGTVPSIPLITASILSKKLAENLQALILDVKFGSAAFMQTREQARELARCMVSLGKECGVDTRALLTNMSVPLGRAAGNWLEVKESVAVLDGNGPDDVRDLTIECAAHLLVQTPKSSDLPDARRLAADMLRSGKPRQKWNEMLGAQGAAIDDFEKRLAIDQTAPVVKTLQATKSGFIETCDARVIGEIVRDLGGGRSSKDTKINVDVGIDQLAKPGETAEPGSILARIHARDEKDATDAINRLSTAFTITTEAPHIDHLLQETIE